MNEKLFRFIVTSFLIFSVNTIIASAEVLDPPINVPFLKDAKIEKYSREDTLQHFKYIGDWEIKTEGTNTDIFGKSGRLPAILISRDKLNTKPKSFKFDFVVYADNFDYGFFLGDAGIAIKRNRIYPALFDKKGDIIAIDDRKAKPFTHNNENKYNILDIVTGYDNIKNSISCVIYINGNGVVFKCPDVDSPFGIYLGPDTNMIIRNIRWGRGSK